MAQRTADKLPITVAVIAYNAESGKKLLEIQSETTGGMGPPITYLIDGKQYVSFMGGAGVGPGNPAPTPAGRGAAAPPRSS